MEPLPEWLANLIKVGAGGGGVAIMYLLVQLARSGMSESPKWAEARRQNRQQAEDLEVARAKLIQQDMNDALLRRREAEKEADHYRAELSSLEKIHRETERKCAALEGKVEILSERVRVFTAKYEDLLVTSTRHEQAAQWFSEFMNSDQASEQSKAAWQTFQNAVKDRRANSTDPGLDKK